MSNPENKGTILWINTLKGACIILVVLHHSIITTLVPSIDYLASGVIPAKLWIFFNQSVSPLRMPAFFFVSGLLAASSVVKKSWPDVFTKKISNLIYLYVLWGSIQWLFIKKVITEPFGAQLSNAENSAYAESISEFFMLLSNAMTSLWYLYALAGYFFFAKLLTRYKYLTILIAVIINYVAGFGLIENWGAMSVAQNMIFFMLGVYLKDIFINLSEIKSKNIFPWVGIIMLSIVNIKLGIGKNIFVCSFAIIASIMFCRFLNEKLDMSWVNWIGKNTLQIYVIHRVFIELFGIIFLSIGIDEEMFLIKSYSLIWGVSFPILSVVICISLSIIVWKILNKSFGMVLFSHPKLIAKK